MTQPEQGKRRYRLKPETELLIKETAKQMGYKPSFMGLSLRHRKSFLIGLLNSSVNYVLHPELNAGIQDVLAEYNFAPIVFTHNQLAEENKYLQSCMERNVEGLLINCAVEAGGRTESAHIAKVYQNGLPIVEVFGRYVPEVPSIAIDYRAAGMMAVEKLWKMGHRKIAIFIHDRYLEGAKARTFWTAHDLWQGYAAAMKKLSLKPLVITYHMAAEGAGPYAPYDAAYQASGNAVHHPDLPTGFVVLGTTSALALLDCVQRHQPPHHKNIHAVCTGKQSSLFYPVPNLTLLSIPAYEVGQAAARLLVMMIQDQAAGKNRARYSDIMIPPKE